MSSKTNTKCSYIKTDGIQCKLNVNKKEKEDTNCRYHKDYGQCGICFENMTFLKSKKLDCNHLFHKSCIERWYLNKTTCPLCREECGQLLPITKEYFRSFIKHPYYGPYYLAPDIELLYSEVEVLPPEYTEVYDGEVVISENEQGIIIRPFMY